MKRSLSFLGGVILGAVVMFGTGRAVLTMDRFDQQFPQKVNIEVSPLVEKLQQSIGGLGGENVQGSGAGRAKYNMLYKLLTDQYYYDERIEEGKMQENALKGFIDALGDPYTVYLTPDENTMFDEAMEGEKEFEGIGAVVIKKEDGVLIEEVLKEHPAFQAGLQPLDIILEIDGESTQSMLLTEAVDKIRGPKGSEVTLTIYRESEAKIMDVVVTRGSINLPSVRGELFDLAGKNVLYIEVLSFGDQTIKIFRDFIAEYQGSKIDGVVLDLRGNGGGYLPVAVELASFFIPRNELVTVAKYSIYPEEKYTSKGYGTFEGLPLVVLIDGMSASASEIVTAALQQQAGAFLIGEKTFGKGSIQTLHQMDDGSSLKYTIGARYTPAGESVDHAGVTPDVEVAFDMEAYLADGGDNQLEVAKEEIEKLIKG